MIVQSALGHLNNPVVQTLPNAAARRTSDMEAFVDSRGNRSELILTVRGAKCGGCIQKIEGAVNVLPGVDLARLNLSSGRMQVKWSGKLGANKVAETIEALGYNVSPYNPSRSEEDERAEERKLVIAMAVAGFGAANIMLLSISVWASAGEMGVMTRQGFHLISGLIALPIIIFSGRHFFSSAAQALRNRHVNMDVPISLAVILAFLTSVGVVISGGEHAYFDACVMLLFFLLIGRFLDAKLRRKAFSAAHALASMQRSSVTRISADGIATSVRAQEIITGDTIMVAPGDQAIIDMTIMSGQSDIDESLVTGESIPRLAIQGTTLFSGTMNLSAPLLGKAIAPASDSLLSHIADMLEVGEQRRSSYRKIADKAVRIYVPFVHTTALLAFLGWLAFGASLHVATLVAVSTLIITCPCALALAAPVAQVVASGKLFKEGVFLKSGDALERLSEIDHIIFDKTGTLTLGEPIWRPSADAELVLGQAARLARLSRHPLSRALVRAAGDGLLADNVMEHPGLGLQGDIDEKSCRLGSSAWVGVAGVGVSGLSLWYAADDEAPVLFEFEDQPRPEAIETIHYLQSHGTSIEIVSGDSPRAVEDMANQLGISNWTAEADPKQKVERLESLQQSGMSVLMVGDGLNDAGALALAHASLAPGGAMDVSQSAADAVFAGDLNAIPFILSVSKSAKRILRQNFAFAAAYNLVTVPIAVTGNVTPLIAAIAMSASSLIVTLNALRIRSGSRRVK